MNHEYAESLAGFTDRPTLEWLHSNAFGNCVEIGTYGGRSAYAIASSNQVSSLFCIDSWQDYNNVHRKPIQAQSEGFPSFTRLLSDHSELPIRFVIGSSLDPAVVNLIENDSIDFLFLDGNHEYEHLLQEISLWMPKVNAEGIICGDDYHFRSVKRAVDSFAVDRDSKVELIAGTHLYKLSRG